MRLWWKYWIASKYGNNVLELRANYSRLILIIVNANLISKLLCNRERIANFLVLAFVFPVIITFIPRFAVWKGSVAGTLSICDDKVEFGRMFWWLIISTHLLNTVSGLTFSSTLVSLISNSPPAATDNFNIDGHIQEKYPTVSQIFSVPEAV